MRVCKTLTLVLSLGIFTQISTAQSSGFSVGSVTAPSMPSVSSPTLGSGFYRPGSTSNPAYSGRHNETEVSKPAAKEKKQAKVNIVNEEISSSVLNQENKSNQVDLPVQTASIPFSKDPAASKTTKSSRLLRFTVNGNDLLKCCRQVYISDVQQDGTFLLTGDSIAQENGKNQEETFHILFTSNPQNSSLNNYSAAAAVTQSAVNKNSFLYQLTQRKDLQASRTGNLVAMRTNDPEWQLELLLDLGESK